MLRKHLRNPLLGYRLEKLKRAYSFERWKNPTPVMGIPSSRRSPSNKELRERDIGMPALKLASPVASEAPVPPKSPPPANGLLARPVSGIVSRRTLLAGTSPTEGCPQCTTQMEPCEACLMAQLQPHARPQSPPPLPREGCEACFGMVDLCETCLAERTRKAVCRLVGKDPNA